MNTRLQAFKEKMNHIQSVVLKGKPSKQAKVKNTLQAKSLILDHHIYEEIPQKD